MHAVRAVRNGFLPIGKRSLKDGCITYGFRSAGLRSATLRIAGVDSLLSKRQFQLSPLGPVPSTRVPLWPGSFIFSLYRTTGDSGSSSGPHRRHTPRTPWPVIPAQAGYVFSVGDPAPLLTKEGLGEVRGGIENPPLSPIAKGGSCGRLNTYEAGIQYPESSTSALWTPACAGVTPHRVVWTPACAGVTPHRVLKDPVVFFQPIEMATPKGVYLLERTCQPTPDIRSRGRAPAGLRLRGANFQEGVPLSFFGLTHSRRDLLGYC
jgi:hypothetical protein